MRLNFSGKFYETGFYGVSDSGRIEMESGRATARNWPKVIVAGWSAYPRVATTRRTDDRRRGAGVRVVSGGTDVHLVLVDLRNSPLDGKAAEDLLHQIGITVNRNAVPNDPRPPMVTSGLRIGTPALAAGGFGDAEFTEVADVIGTALTRAVGGYRGPSRRVTRLASEFPLYEGLDDWELHGRK